MLFRSIRESVVWDGLRYQLCDTAGIRASKDSVEVEGMERGSAMISESHMILVVNDHAAGPPASHAIIREIVSTYPEKKVVLVQNKCDDAPISTYNDEGMMYGVPQIFVSAKTGYNISQLRDFICREARSGTDVQQDVLLNERQLLLLQKTQAELMGARAALDDHDFSEGIAYQIRQAVDT